MTSTAKQLAELPELAALVFTAWGHPFRPQEEAAHKPIAGPRVPIDLDAYDALRPDEHGLLFELSQAVRATAEQIRRDDDDWPDMADPATWVSECSFLTKHAGKWQADDYLSEYVPDQVRHVWTRLRDVLREPRPMRFLCLDCREPLNLDAGALVCSGCGHVYHARDIAYEAQERILTPSRLVGLREAARLIGRPAATVHRWVKAGLVEDHGGKYDIAKVERLASVVRQGVRTEKSGT